MFGTYVLDAYRTNERQEVREALQAVPGRGFSATGVYAYFNYHTSELLYVGLATSLADRLATHNVLAASSSSGHKRDEIDAYFDECDLLGFAVVLQSSLQSTGKMPAGTDTNAISAAKAAEGQILQGYVAERGELPPWNKADGSRYGQHLDELRSGNEVRPHHALVGRFDSVFHARRRLRTIANHELYLLFEEQLHALRMFGPYAPPFREWPDRIGEPYLGMGLLNYLTPKHALVIDPPPGRSVLSFGDDGAGGVAWGFKDGSE